MDKAIRAALLTAKGMDKPSENIADYVAELLRQGRASEVTDDLMAQADQQRLMHHYKSGNTGADMPMDYASRMERAGQMGLDAKAYHGTTDDFPAFDRRAYAASNYGVHSGAKEAANTILMHQKSKYDKSLGASDHPHGSAILPLMTKTKNNLRIGDTGDWQPNKVMSAMAWSDNPDTEAMYHAIENHPSFPRFGTDDEVTKFIGDSLSQAGHTGFTYHNDYEGGGDSHATLDPTNIRSQFARFDPRLSHLSHLSASTGGAMELARAVMAKNRAGGQIAPSKYLPGVPRQVHAGGGKVAFMQGNHPDVPDVLYHNTNKDFSVFDPSKSSSGAAFGPGIYLSEEKEGSSGWSWGEGNNVMPLHVSIKNPLNIRKPLLKHEAEALNRIGLVSAKEGNPAPLLSMERKFGSISEAAKAAGFDGLLHYGPSEKKHILAFKPEQVKSAIGNQGTFDPTDPDMTKAEGGAVTDTDEFRNWFGNSVTHTNGQPHVFYTGTSKDKDFTSHNVGRHGAWFTRDPEVASQYAEQNDSQGYKREGFKLTPTNTASRVIPAYVKAENPYTGELPEEYLRDNYKAAQSEWFDTLRAKGHDAWIPASQNGNLVVALKEPQQIKSIFNSGKFDPNQKHMNKAEGGRAGYSNGGKSLGLYSKAAQIIRNQPQAKGNVDQLLAMVSKAKGVKPTELANAGRPASDTMTKEELAQHFEQALPDVQVEKLEKKLPQQLTEDEANVFQKLNRFIDKGFPLNPADKEKWKSLFQKVNGLSNTKYDQYTLPNGTNYREHLLHLPPQEGPLAKRKKVLQDQWQQAYENQAPKEELDRLGAEFDSLSSDEENPDFRSDHWRTPNVLAHVRMDEHDNGKTLHVQEVQSDWGQQGRETGFHDPENPFEVIHRKTKEVVSRHPDFSSMWDAYRLHPDSDNLNYGDVREEKPPQGPYVGNTQQWTDLALKHILTEAAKNGNYDRVVFSPGEANADLYGQRKTVSKLEFLKSNSSGESGILSGFTPNGYLSSQHDVESHADLPKLIGKENAANLLAQPPTPSPDKGEDRYTHTLQGPLQVGGHGMVDYYKNYVHPGALKLLQQHDPSIKPESYDLPEGYKGFSLPMTDTARQSILKNGFQAFQRGGEVHKATGGTVMGYVPTAPIQIRQLAVAPIVPRQQQRAAGSFSNSLMSLMDTVKGFKNGPEPTPTAEQPFMPPIGQPATPAAEQPVTPSASTEGHTTSAPSEGNAPEQPSYDITGMSDAAMSAYGKLTDSWGQPISVVSGYRDADKNQAVGGAKASQHLHGNAYDIDTSGYSYEDRLRLADAAKAAGFSGFGFYGNNMHLDVGPTRAWGPSYHSDSIPDWARAWVNTNIYAAPPRAMGGSVNKALALTRGFTKDGKSAIVFLKPKGK